VGTVHLACKAEPGTLSATVASAVCCRSLPVMISILRLGMAFSAGAFPSSFHVKTTWSPGFQILEPSGTVGNTAALTNPTVTSEAATATHEAARKSALISVYLFDWGFLW